MTTFALASALLVGGAAPASATGATYMVDSTADTGGECEATPTSCTLRQAINSANAHPGADAISFAITTSAPWTIAPATELPAITDPVVLDGTTQPGFVAQPVIEIAGSNVPSGSQGLTVVGTHDVTIRALVINGFAGAAGVFVDASDRTHVDGSYLGTDATGSASAGNNYGVHVNGGQDTVIGGQGAGLGNVLSGNGYGIYLTSTDRAFVFENRIGTDASGTNAVPNFAGIVISSTSNAVIGGPGAGNLVANNGGWGISPQIADHTTIQSNTVRNNGIGIYSIDDVDGLIGGDLPTYANDISGSTFAGIKVGGGSHTKIRQNRIHDNAELAIDLDGDGVTVNDSSDTDTGPNNLQNFPELDSAVDDSASTSVIYGTLDSDQSKTYLIELFANDTCDTSGHGEAQTFIGQASSVGGGNWNTHVNAAHPGKYITATAIDPETGDTSELSNCVLEQGVAGPYADPVVNTVADHDDGACEPLDTGDCTLREAINATNAHAGADSITFAIPGSGIQTIQPLTELPAITDAVVTDATTQPGYSTGLPVVELDGANLTNWTDSGLTARNADAVTIRGFVVNRFPASGVLLDNTTNAHVEGNLIGTDATGTVNLGNSSGVDVTGGSGNVIGGPSVAQRNVLSGSGAYGVSINPGTANTTVQGNYIGTDITGTAPIGNYAGVVVRESSDTFVLNNLVAANPGWGVTPQNSTHTVVQGNTIGVDSPDNSMSNGTGIYSLGVTSNDLYGGTAPGTGNVIAHNKFDGVNVGPSNSGVTIEGNSIFDNGRLPYPSLGIALDFDGVTANDPGDADGGANHRQNYPVVTSATTDGVSTTVTGTLDSDVTHQFRVEAFGNNVCSPSGNGEGETFLGAASVTGTNQPFTLVVGATPVDTFVTTTATDLTTGDTSEFSACQLVTSGPSPFANPVVNTLADHDDGTCDVLDCTLREAISATEQHAGHDTITFSVAGTIDLSSSLPQIRDAVTIDGTNGACAPTVQVDGTNTGPFARGLWVIGTDGTSISGLALTHFAFAGIGLDSNTHVRIECNYVGLALDGVTDAGNAAGIRMDDEIGDTIGGASLSSRNVISGNDAEGIRIGNSALNTIAHNYIGTDASGTVPVANSTGLFLTVHAANTTVGPGNVISGNQAAGVSIETSATLNAVIGNSIGAAPNGTDAVDPSALPQIGVLLNGTDANVIGGTAGTSANLIAHNSVGVLVVLNTGQGNQVLGNSISDNTQDGVNLNGAISTDVGSTATGAGNLITRNAGTGVLVRGGSGNRVEGNSVYDNGQLGIDLAPAVNDGADGVTPNDSGDTDEGANRLQNFPVLSTAVNDGTNVSITGSLDSNPSGSYRVELFGNTACDASGNGEGMTFLGALTVSGAGEFTSSVPTTSAGAFITATATDSSANTSEFSACRAVTAAPPPPPHCVAADTVNGIVVSMPPADLTLGATESDDCVLLFDERQAVTLAAPITVKPAATDNAMAHADTTLPAGAVVNSYYLHYDPQTNTGANANATYMFEDDVIGFVVDSSVLHNSDGTLGFPDPSHTTGIAYPTDGQGLEPGGGDTGDLLQVGADGRTVTFRFNATSGSDHVRVLTGHLPYGRVSVQKTTVPSGSTQGFDFTLQRTDASGSNETLLAQHAGDPPRAFADVPPGTYAVTEASMAGWDTTSATCDNRTTVAVETTPAASLTVAGNDDWLCAFTNTQRGTLTLAKDATPHATGDVFAFAGAFGAFLADGQSTSVSVAPGTYTETEQPKNGWDLDQIVCADPGADSTADINTRSATFRIAAGETVACTFKNVERAVISVRKATVPASDPQPFDFSVRRASDNGVETFVNGVKATDAGPTQFAALRPGTYAVVEQATAHWDQTAATCDDRDTAAIETVNATSLSVIAGSRWLCTFTNQKRGSVTIQKAAVGGDGSFSFALTSQANRTVTTSGGSGSTTWTDVVAGDYTVTENVAAVAGVFDLTNVSCSIAGSAATNGRSFHLTPGQDVSCSFTNVKRGHLIVVKTTDDGAIGGNPDFTFTRTAGANITLKAGQQTDISVAPGTYQVTETPIPAGWSLRSITCVDPSGGTTTSGAGASYGIAAGETVRCTYTNHWTHADLKVDVIQPAGVYVGDPFSVQVRVTNLGPDPAVTPVVNVTLSNNVVVTAALPSGCTQPQPANPSLVRCNLPTMASGAVATRVVSVRTKVVGADCTIWGGSGADTLSGTGNNDVICGLAGDDTINAGSGADTVYGDDPPNALATFNVVDSATVASTTPDAALANNTASATTVATLRNDDGADTVSGGAGNDTVFGQGAKDTIDGGGGDDIIHGNGGNDVINGGAGDDVIHGNDGNDTIHGDGGDDFLLGDSGTDTLFGDTGNDGLHGGATPGTATNQLNILSGGAGNDCASRGNDRYSPPPDGNIEHFNACNDHP